MGSISQLRRLRDVYAGGVVAWTLCLLLNVLQGEGSARQMVLLLGLLAVFLVLLLWSAWCLWDAGAHRGMDRPGRTANAHAEPS
ncbi:hypothetical protein AB0L04_13345 [Streptomyces glaucescens]|uniref:hypothetical protein n=1 Tax=Streptomyces glaucescens TaxID=1907 RepID=UPI00344C433B